MGAPTALAGTSPEGPVTHDEAHCADTRPQVPASVSLPVTRRAAAPAAAAPAAARNVASAELFAGAAEVQISHHGAVYRLRQTALGKLILTK